jgi:uncharacterized protein (TIGR00730 family)
MCCMTYVNGYKDLKDTASLKAELIYLLDNIQNIEHGEIICQSLSTILQISQTETERLDWKVIAGSLQDMRKAIAAFYPYRYTRKVSIFGSARTSPLEPEYMQAMDFARCITSKGFMVITGAGGGIMAAGNEGASKEHSFGLNIDLPFEQTTNEHVQDSDRLLQFKYFFTRKLFFLKESDAIALFPGGFGTQDEFFECLTLCQTGKSTPKALVLVDKPGGDYWLQWDVYIRKHLLERRLIGEDDRSLYTIVDSVEAACQTISNFYSIYHSSRWIGNLFAIRLNCNISDSHLDRLNQKFSDILVSGKIERSNALDAEMQDDRISHLPRLTMYFNQLSYGRLNELIAEINLVGADEEELLKSCPLTQLR